MKHLSPFGRENFDFARLDIVLPDMTYKGASDASLLHRLQVVLHALYRDIVRDPIPIDRHTLVFRKTLKVVQ
jgi:hypothetical protein